MLIGIESGYKYELAKFEKRKTKLINKSLRTSHSLCPWKLSNLSFLIATTIPVPGFVGAKVFSSIQPLKTHPNPPSPRSVSDRKFLVAFLRSLKLKDLRLLETDVSALRLLETGVWGLDATNGLLKISLGDFWVEEVDSCFVLLWVFALP